MALDITIVVIDYKSTQYLLELVHSLEVHSSRVASIVVVDNSPDPLDAGVVQQASIPIQVVRPARNLGFTAGNNIGFRHVTTPYVLFMNPDMKLVNDVPGIMAECLDRNQRIGVIGPKFLNPDGTHQISTRAFPSFSFAVAKTVPPLRRRFRKEWVRYYDARVNPDFAKSVDTVSTGAFMIRSELFRDLSGFDEHTFMYGEDAELCKRVRDRGLKVTYFPEAVLIHYGGQSSKKASRLAIRSYYYSFYYLFKKHVIGNPILPLRPVFRIAAELHIVRMSFRKDKRLTWAEKSK